MYVRGLVHSQSVLLPVIVFTQIQCFIPDNYHSTVTFVGLNLERCNQLLGFKGHFHTVVKATLLFPSSEVAPALKTDWK